jgi:hypothetical protein
MDCAIYFVPTKHNVADVLTKPLAKIQFEYLRNILMQGHGGKESQWAWEDENAHMALTARSV